MSQMELLLLSSSSVHGQSYLAYAVDEIAAWLDGRTQLVFAPFAGANHDSYTERVRETLSPLGVSVTGLHAVDDPVAALRSAEVFFVGGGNSFRLLKTLQQLKLIEPVRELVGSGQLAYMGASAGTNMACPTLRTTNDMPIVQPASFAAFELIPFQINPHYTDPDPTSTHMGETREMRIAEFLEENDVPVLGMREGSWLRREDDSLTLGGSTGARLMRRGMEAVEFEAGADMSFLLEIVPRFDTPLQ